MLDKIIPPPFFWFEVSDSALTVSLRTDSVVGRPCQRYQRLNVSFTIWLRTRYARPSPFSPLPPLFSRLFETNPDLVTGAPGLAPGLSAPSGGCSSLLPANFNFNAPVIHFGQTLSGATTISTPQTLATPIAKPIVARVEGPRLPPTNDDILHTVFIGNIPEDLTDEWMERIARVPFSCFLLLPIELIRLSVKSLGKLKEWRRATDGSDKLRSFGFAIFHDAESTNRAFQILQSIEIPDTQPGKPGTKLSVSCKMSMTSF